MRKSILLLSVILVCLSTVGAQELAQELILIEPMPPDVAIIDTVFLNGNIASIDSIFSYGFRKKTKQYIQDARGNTSLKAEGLYSSPKKQNWYKNGLWAYWDNEGQMLYKVFQDLETDIGFSYINQILPDGRQLLKNGEGHYIESQSVLGICEYTGKELSIDSLVFTIADSIKSGPYELWRLDVNNEYYLAERGQDGQFSATKSQLRYRPYPGTYNPQSKQLYFPDGTLSAIMHFKFDKIHGPYHKFHANGQYAEFGNFDEGVKKGVWKTWNEDGELLEALVYAPWQDLGDYYEFYDTGQIKAIGTFGYVTGADTIEVLNPDTYEYKTEIIQKKYSNGEIEHWQYFDRQGNVVDELPE